MVGRILYFLIDEVQQLHGSRLQIGRGDIEQCRLHDMYHQTAFGDLGQHLFPMPLGLELFFDLSLDHAQVAQLQHPMAGLELFIIVGLKDTLPSLEDTVEGLGHLSEAFGIDPRHRVHNNKQRQQKRNHVGVGQEPPPEVLLVILLAT